MEFTYVTLYQGDLVKNSVRKVSLNVHYIHKFILDILVVGNQLLLIISIIIKINSTI